MNLIDVAVLVVFALFVLACYNRGFLMSVLNIAAFMVSWLLAIALLMPVASTIKSDEKLMNMMLYYTEGSERIYDIEVAHANVTSLSAQQISDIVSQADLPKPFNTLVYSNVENGAFEDDGITTLGDYFNQTIVRIVINILVFLLLFLIIRALLAFVLHGVDYAYGLPVLKQFDGLIASGIGLIRGFLAVFVIFAVVPVIIAVLPASADADTVSISNVIAGYINNSFFGGFFLNSNFLLSLIPGV